jgi:hydroxyquinol 1,2-dioxygenase
VHFVLQAARHETPIPQLFRRGETYLDSDVVFGMRASLVADFVSHARGTAPHAESRVAHHTHNLTFTLAPQAPR